jgi:hypothetical protein
LRAIFQPRYKRRHYFSPEGCIPSSQKLRALFQPRGNVIGKLHIEALSQPTQALFQPEFAQALFQPELAHPEIPQAIFQPIGHYFSLTSGQYFSPEKNMFTKDNNLIESPECFITQQQKTISETKMLYNAATENHFRKQNVLQRSNKKQFQKTTFWENAKPKTIP